MQGLLRGLISRRGPCRRQGSHGWASPKVGRRTLALEGLEARRLLSVTVAEFSAGDANGDGLFDQNDMYQVLQAGKYLTGEPADWSEGDFNGDGLFNQRDLVAALQTGTYGDVAFSATEDDIEASIVAGLEWLASQQKDDGGFGEVWWCDRVARTGLAVLKFEDRAIDLGFEPLAPEYEYSTVVREGLDYILSKQLNGTDIGGVGVYYTDCGHEIYNTGIAMMAIAASGDADLQDELQGTVDFMAWAQADPGCGVHRGGWRYAPNTCDSDNSNSGYATLGLGFAAAPSPYGMGLTVPQVVKDELSIWIDVIQDDVDGDLDDGGSWYDPSWWWDPWVNILKTGNLMYEQALVGDPVDAQRVQDALDYIERHWTDPGGGGTGWLDHRQAMFTMMKGFEAYGIDLIDLDNDSVPEHDWFDEVSTHLVTTQNPDGSWPADPWEWDGQILSTSWALLTLERAVPTFEIPVPFDIKPTSCPNPLNLKGNGVLPAAILGTEELDVRTIDPSTVALYFEDPDVSVPPLRWSYEDVATPFDGEFTGDCMDCTEEGPDGYEDLTLKFDTSLVVEILGLADCEDRACELLTVTGNLTEEAGGTPIVGQDVVRIQKKGK